MSHICLQTVDGLTLHRYMFVDIANYLLSLKFLNFVTHALNYSKILLSQHIFGYVSHKKTAPFLQLNKHPPHVTWCVILVE